MYFLEQEWSIIKRISNYLLENKYVATVPGSSLEIMEKAFENFVC